MTHRKNWLTNLRQYYCKRRCLNVIELNVIILIFWQRQLEDYLNKLLRMAMYRKYHATVSMFNFMSFHCLHWRRVLFKWKIRLVRRFIDINGYKRDISKAAVVDLPCIWPRGLSSYLSEGWSYQTYSQHPPVSLYLLHGSVSLGYCRSIFLLSITFFSVDELKCWHLIGFFDGVNRLPFSSSKMEFIDVSQMSFIHDLGPKGLWGQFFFSIPFAMMCLHPVWD